MAQSSPYVPFLPIFPLFDRIDIILFHLKIIKHKRSGNYWTKDEVKHLSDLFFDGFGISSIALELQRTEVAVFQQLMYQGFIKSYGVRRNRGRNKVKCLCSKCDLQEHCPKCGTCKKER